jgi:hypothetical protein
MSLMKWICIGLFAATAAFACAETAPLPDSAKLLGPETLFMLSVNNLTQARAELEKTRLYDLYKDPAMQPFIEQIKRRMNEEVQKQTDDLLRLMAQSEVLPSGRVLLAMSLPEGEQAWEFEPRFAALVQWGEKIAPVREAIEKGIEKQIADGAHKKVERYRGAEIITVLTPAEAPDPDFEDEDEVGDEDGEVVPDEPEQSHCCFIDDMTLFSNDLKTLQFMIAQHGGAQSRTLADDAEYQKARRAVGPAYDAELYVNIKLLLDKLFAEGDPEEIAEVRKTFATLGLDGLSCVAAAADLAPKAGTTLSVKTLLATGSPRRGILKMLELSPKPFRPPLFVDPLTTDVSFINLNIPAAADELFRILAAMNPMFAATMSNPITPPQADGAAGVILKDDLLDNLGDQIVYYQSFQNDPAKAGGFATEQVFAIAVRDAERLNRAVAALHSQFIAAQKPDLQREYLGQTLYVIPMLDLFMPEMETDGTQGNPMAVTITQTHLLVGARNALEKAIQRQTQPQTQPLADTAWFRRGMTALPADAGAGSVENVNLRLTHLWTAVKSGKLFGLIEIGFADDETLKPFLEVLSLLPEYEKVQRHFGINTGWVRMRPDGFLMEMIDIPAPESSN